MEANELRLGNLIIEDGKQTEFNGDFYHWCDDIMKPITLNEEWLIKFKFKKQEDGFLYRKLKRMGTRLEINMKKKLICLTHNGMPMDVVHLPYIKHVHQLQNLYFALTGVELELSSNVA